MCKKQVFLISAFVVMVLAGSAIGAVECKLWWEFEGNTNDTVGSNDGTLTGTETYVPGVGGGQAISLDGATKVEKTGATGLPLAGDAPYDNRATNFSINMWVWQDAAASTLDA